MRSLPLDLQQLVTEFPPGSTMVLPGGKQVWVVGYSEPDMLVCSRANPAVDDHAMHEAQKVRLCASHFRQTH